MSAPKRHHFVPQFYFRRFSKGARFIRCYHKSSKIVIPVASIKGQCALDNFYGWDKNVEYSLGIIERRAAKILRFVSETQTLPRENSEDWQELLTFIALQSSRTQLSGSESDEMADYYFKVMHRYEAEQNGINLDNFKIGSKFPAALPMQVAIEAFPALNSLFGCLLINKSRIPFFASDNPIIFYNSRFSHVVHIGTIGLTSQGLQIFYPIDDSHVIMLYDPNAYQCPSNTRSKIIRESDVIKLNMINYLWSGEVVYWSNKSVDDIVVKIGNYCDNYLPYERTINRESEQIEIGEDQTGALLHSWRAHAPIEVDFRFVNPSKIFKASPSLVRGAPKAQYTTGGREYIFRVETSPRRQMGKADVNRAVNAITKTLDRRA